MDSSSSEEEEDQVDPSSPQDLEVPRLPGDRSPSPVVAAAVHQRVGFPDDVYHHPFVNLNPLTSSYEGSLLRCFVIHVQPHEDVRDRIQAFCHVGPRRTMYVLGAMGHLSRVSLICPDNNVAFRTSGTCRILRMIGSYLAGHNDVDFSTMTIGVMSQYGFIHEGLTAVDAPLVADGVVSVLMATTLLDFHLIAED